MSRSVDRIESLAPYAHHFGRSLPDILADLERLCATLEKWQRMQNLVSRETVATVWERHILDSLQLLPLMEDHFHEQAPANILDIGSGGGFPALPLAIALKERPVHLHLIESRSRKCAFLKAVVRDLNLAADVHAIRIEAVDIAAIGPIRGVTARALAPLELLFAYIEPFWRPLHTKAFLHKGREFGEELRQADSVWRSDVVKHPSKVDPQGVILEITGLERIG